MAFDRVLTAPPTATAPGLLLRPWDEQDIPAMVVAHRDPIMRQRLRHPVTTADEARHIIRTRRADGDAGTGFHFAVLLADSRVPGDLVGSVSVRGFSFSDILPPLLPDFPDNGHLHIRLAGSRVEQ